MFKYCAGFYRIQRFCDFLAANNYQLLCVHCVFSCERAGPLSAHGRPAPWILQANSGSRRGLILDKHCKAREAFNQIKNLTFHFQIQGVTIYIWWHLESTCPAPSPVLRAPLLCKYYTQASPFVIRTEHSFAETLVIDLHAKFFVRSKFNIKKNFNL